MKSEIIIEKIQNKLEESDPENRTLVNIFLFNFTDQDGNLLKNYVFDFKDLKIFEGTIDNPDVEITITDDDFYLIGTKEITFASLIETGKVEIKGDRDAFDKMVEKFKMNSKKE